MDFFSAVGSSSPSMVVKPIRRSCTLHLPSSFLAAIQNPSICLLSLRAGRSTSGSFAVLLSTESKHTVSHGPCLDKGKALQDRIQDRALFEEVDKDVVQGEANKVVFDESVFTRVYDISAIRIPSKQCLGLENLLRGHLLNWPRVSNIARVPGDDVEEGFEPLFGGKGNYYNAEEREDPLNKQLCNSRDQFSPILYRENLMKTFNSRGYLRFRELAQLSSPKMSKKKKRNKYANYGGKREEKMGFVDSVELSSLEVVDNGAEEVDNMRGLLGDEFTGSRWSGPTRLLLLDEQYSNKTLEKMPGAIKALFSGSRMEDTPSSYQLVRCKLTLFYDYWQMNEVLAVILPKGVTVPSAFERVGHVAIMNLQDEHLPHKKLIAQVVLSKNKQRIRTVVNKIDPIHNDHRTTPLEVLAGNRSVVAAVVENGMHFIVDLSTVYWNSRLSTERQRLVSYFGQNDIVMFSQGLVRWLYSQQ